MEPYKTKNRRRNKQRLPVVLSLSALGFLLIAILLGASKSTHHIIAWSASQWIPLLPLRLWLSPWINLNQARLNEAAWEFWEQRQRDREEQDENQQRNGSLRPLREEIPLVQVQEFTSASDLLRYLIATYGSDWRRRPLLLKGLWHPDVLRQHTVTVDQSDESTSTTTSTVATDSTDSTDITHTPPSTRHRRLSLQSLLQENLTIPYFTDARKGSALSPDAVAPIKDIIANMTRGAPHKIATQLLLQTFPELIQEVAPLDIVTKLFGSYFHPLSIQGSGPLRLFPALTTVPLFIANSGGTAGTTDDDDDNNNDPFHRDSNRTDRTHQYPFTALHCEPIGNVAVQLSGAKRWTLVRSEFTPLLKPFIAPDGRAFFASGVALGSSSIPIAVDNDTPQLHMSGGRVPVYVVDTQAGDAIWVPTWTWHRVDYIASTTVSTPDQQIAIGASLFHFRPIDFVVNNPLLAFLIVPAILLELVGYNTQ